MKYLVNMCLAGLLLRHFDRCRLGGGILQCVLHNLGGADCGLASVNS